MRKVDGATGVITTVVGNGIGGFSGDGGPARQAQLNRPHSLFVDRFGDLYLSDFRNNRIRRVEGLAAPTLVNDGVVFGGSK